ncbi:MAG: acetolactate synthase large subunit [Candidatus Acidiferrum sp.]|jgi:acetolactate synthase-1/2/3 large subunit
MNGAEGLVATLLGAGVEVCFTNPGTSEMHIVAAFDHAPQMRCVLGLFEGVVTGAADGYARMAGKPACTLLHLGPGLANGLANLHNASRARTPIINIIGQHARQHLRHDTPLRADIEGIARPYSSWVRTSSSVAEVSRDATDAILASRTAPGNIATLIVPADLAWSEGGMVTALPELPAARRPESRNIERAAAMLKTGLPTCFLLAGDALFGAGLAAAGRIASATGAKLLAPYPFARMERGAHAPFVGRIPYIFEQASALLKEFRQMILVGASAPRSYFAHPVKDSVPTPAECEIHELAVPGEDYAAALDALASALRVPQASSPAAKAVRPEAPSGAINFPGLAAAVAAVLPENAIVVDESMTSGRGLMEATRGIAPHDWLANTGGSIGIAMPLAVGAAVACPDRKVLCLSADGSGMYTLQALWTMAREGLNVTTVVYANRVYGVLKREFSSLGIGEPGPRALNLFEIGRPDLDWGSLAKGMGVPATRVSSLESFTTALRDGFATDGPSLIQVDV